MFGEYVTYVSPEVSKASNSARSDGKERLLRGEASYTGGGSDVRMNEQFYEEHLLEIRYRARNWNMGQQILHKSQVMNQQR